MNYSIKKKPGLFWKNGLTLAQIHEDFADAKPGEILVCPRGEASKAVCLTELFANPGCFGEEVLGVEEVLSEEQQARMIARQTLAKLDAIHFWVRLTGLIVLAVLLLRVLSWLLPLEKLWRYLFG